ncbi:MAG: hypothetical protein KGQ41_02080 [Alphaproteobacteria bacterium]|nr:hypothetical protein [Alphaproteobacteria bacterium]
MQAIVTADKKPLYPFGLPLAEMHIHISLALLPELFLRRIKQGRTTIKPEFLLKRDDRYYPTLSHHHAVYEQMRHITSTPSELAQVTQDYLERIAREGAIYAEISNSFRDPKNFEGQLDALEESIRCARHNTGIEARIVVTTLRGPDQNGVSGPDRAETAACYMAKHPREFVTGFGLVGDEGLDSFADYARAFAIAFHEAGLGLAPHVAEQFLHNAVDFLHTVPKEALNIKSDDHRRLRAGHATLIHTSTKLMDSFGMASVGIESLLSANNRINLPEETRKMRVGDVITSESGRSVTVDRPLQKYFKNVADHPLAHFRQRGLNVCLGSDNPLLQNTNIGKEYSLAVKAGLATVEDLLDLTANAIRFANVDNVTRLALMQKVELYRAQLSADKLPNQTAGGYRRSYTI